MMRPNQWLQPACLAAAILLALPVAVRGDETSAAFLALWKQAADDTAPPPAWSDFADKNPRHDLGTAARLLAAADLLRKGDAKGAAALAAAAAADPDDQAASIRKFCAAAAKGLIARTQMVQLEGKLRAYYARHVEYPASLDELLAAKLVTEADLTDPFGQRFGYTAMERTTFPTVPRQVFTLVCNATKAEHSDLAAALDQARRPVKGVTLSNTDPDQGQAFLKKSRADGSPGPSLQVPVGQEIGGVTLWGVFDGFVLVGWRDFPVVIAKE